MKVLARARENESPRPDVGYTLGTSIALQYGLDYPDEVKGLVLMTVAARPKVRAPGTYEMRLRAPEDPNVYEEWLAYQRRAMHLVEPGLRERLMERHRQDSTLVPVRSNVLNTFANRHCIRPGAGATYCPPRDAWRAESAPDRRHRPKARKEAGLTFVYRYPT